MDGGANSVIRIGEGEVAGNPEVELNVNGFGEASGQIEDTLVGDRDVFHVYSDRRSQFTINVSTIDNTLDTFLRVYDSLGNLVAIDDDGGDGRNSQATFTAFMGETYQIEVAGYNDNSVGSYRVTVQQADLPEAVRVGTYDDFNDNLIDAEKWTSSASGSARVREEGRRIQLLADGANATSDNNVASLQSLIALRENIEFDVTPRLGRDQNFGYVEMASGSAFIRLRFGSDGAGGVQLTVENAGYVELENAGPMAVTEGVAAHVAFRNTSDGVGVYVNGVRKARFEGSLRPDSVLRTRAESAQSASRLQLTPYDDFNDNSINTAKWNVSGGVRESSERLYLYATEGSQARQQNATTQGKPGGDNIHGARWTMSYLDTEADGMDHWSEITNGTDYIRFFYKSTGPWILVQLGGVYGSGEVTKSQTAEAVVEVKEESGDITIRIGGELKYTIRGKQLSANSYFRAFAQYNGGNPSGYGDKRMTVDDLSIYQIVTTPDDERLAELIVDNVQATYRPRYDWVPSLYDDFQDGQLDHSKWNAAGTVEEQDGVLRLPLFRDHQPVSGFISTAGMPGGMNLRGFSANVNRRSGPITVGAVPGHEFDTWARMRLTNGQDWIEVGWNLKNNSFKVETRGFYGSRTEEFPVSEGIVDGGFGVREFNGNIEVLHDGQVKLTVPGKTVRAGSFFTFESNGSPPNGGTPYDPPTDFEVMIDNLTFYVDPVPPNFKPAPALTKESDSGDSDADHVTNRLSLDFEWAVGTDGTRYQWREGELQEDGSIVYGTWSPPQSGTTAHVELPHGSIHVFSVRPIDAAGMVGEASARAFVVDTNPPTLQSAEAIAGIHPRLELQFSESVYGEPSDLTVLDGNGNPIVPVTIEGWGTPELTVEFVGPIWSGSATVRLNGTQSVKDIAGNRLDGNDDGTAGGDAVRAVTFLVNYWTNPVNACDVNSENSVTPLDALELINWINSHPGQTQLPGTQSTPPKFFDTSGDGMITAQDVIVVINYINKRIADAEGEGTTWHAWPIVPEGRALANDFDNVTLANQAVSPARSRHKSAEFWSASQDAAVPTVSACLSARLAAVDTRTRSDELDLAIQDIAGHIARVWELIP